MKLTPEIVEERISEAGRERVFNQALELGWLGKEPPLWVWNQIALEIIAADRVREGGKADG